MKRKYMDDDELSNPRNQKRMNIEQVSHKRKCDFENDDFIPSKKIKYSNNEDFINLFEEIQRLNDLLYQMQQQNNILTHTLEHVLNENELIKKKSLFFNHPQNIHSIF